MPESAVGHDDHEAAEVVTAVLAAYRDAWNAGDADAFGDLFTADATYVIFLGDALLGRVDRVSRGLPLPADAVQVWVDAVPSDWCLATCSSVERDYVVPDGDAALAALETGLREHGWRRVGAAWCRGGFSVRTGPMSPDDPRLVTRRTQNPNLQAIKVLTKARCDG